MLVLDIDACIVLVLCPLPRKNVSIGLLIIELGPHVYECKGLVQMFAMVNREPPVMRKDGLVYFWEAVSNASDVCFGDKQLERMLLYDCLVVRTSYEADAPCECAGSALVRSAFRSTKKWEERSSG